MLNSSQCWNSASKIMVDVVEVTHQPPKTGFRRNAGYDNHQSGVVSDGDGDTQRHGPRGAAPQGGFTDGTYTTSSDDDGTGCDARTGHFGSNNDAASSH